MDKKYTIALAKVVEEFNLEIVHESSDFKEKQVTMSDVNRPGLQLTGFYDYFDPERIQIIGKVETTYLSGISPEERMKQFQALMAQKIVALIVCHGMEVFPECLEMAKKYDVTILKSPRVTSELMAGIISALKVAMAPRITRHGVLVEVYGEGLLLLGESGVGKSETAIELVKRGHRLIADDAVEIRRVSDTTLVGSAPELIKYYIELRGIGVVDVRRLFGVGAIKPTERIDLVINIEQWQDGMMYDRLGLENQYTSILGINVPSLTVPVKPGRNLAVIIEVAAMNNRQKRMGYNAAVEFTKQINKHFDESFGSMMSSSEE